MSEAAARRRARWPALLATVAALLAATVAQASLPRDAGRSELLAKPTLAAALANADRLEKARVHTLDPADEAQGTLTGSLGGAHRPTFTVDLADALAEALQNSLGADKARVHTRSFALFAWPPRPAADAGGQGLASALEAVGPEKLTSGSLTWEPRVNIWRIRYVASILQWAPEKYAFVAWQPQMYRDPMGECLFGIGGTCEQWANKVAGGLETAKEFVREHTGGDVLGVGADYAVSNVLDIAEMVAVDPFRVGGAAGQAVGEGAGIGRTALAVVHDVGRAATLVGGAGAGVKGVAKVTSALPVRGSTGAAKLRGRIGEALTVVERALHGERVVGKQVTLAAEGARARFDFVTKNVFTGKLRVVEAKFGRTAELMRGQPHVAEAIQKTGEALARGPKTVTTFRKLGFEGGSFKKGLEVQDLEFTEQRFDFLAKLFERLL